MKKLVIMLVFASLSSFCFAQESIKLSPTNSIKANKIFKSYYPETTFNFPLTTVLVGFGVITESFGDIAASIECENKVNNALVDYISECGYETAPFSTEEDRVLVKVVKANDFLLWSLKVGYFTVEHRNEDNGFAKAYVCYGYDFNMDDHIKVYTKTMNLDHKGKVIASDTSYFPPIK